MAESHEQTKPNTFDKSDAIDTLERTIGFVRNCDNKASFFLGAFGVILAIVLTTDGINSLIAIVSTAIEQISFCNILYLLFMVGAGVVTIFGLSNVIKVLGVTTVPEKEKGLDCDSKIFFDCIARNANYMTYKNKLYGMSDEEFMNDITSQIYINSCICKEKYKNYKLGFAWSIVGFSAFVVLWIIGVVIF